MKKENKSLETFLTTVFKKQKSVISAKLKQILKNYTHRKVISKSCDMEYMERLFPFQSISKNGFSTEAYLAELEDKLLPYTTNVASPKFIGHMTSALPNFIPDVAKLITILNQNVVKLETALSATFYERQAIAMLHELMYNNTRSFYKEHIHNTNSTLGIVSSGGTIANITALQCARNLTFLNIEEEGLHKDNKGVIICSELGHYSIKKAMGLLGLGTNNLLTVPIDDKNKICVGTLKKTILRCEKKKIKIIALIGIAGSTECGSIDPLDALATIAKSHNIYFHVDAAWGGPVMFSEVYSHLLKGIEKADSITIDGHKQLYLPMGIGLTLFKNPETARLIEKQSEYIIRKSSLDLGKRSIEGSRPSNSFYLQATLKLMGSEKYGWLIEKGIENALSMSNYINHLDDFELLTFPETNIFLYRYIPKQFRNVQKSETVNRYINNFNKKLQRKQMKIGASFVSYTTVSLKKYDRSPIVGLRIVLANPLVTTENMHMIIESQRVIAKEIIEIL